MIFKTISQLIEIIQSTAIRRNEERIDYLLKWKYNQQPSVISSVDARERWPQLIIDFLENKIVFTRNFERLNLIGDDATEEENPIGMPTKITCKRQLI